MNRTHNNLTNEILIAINKIDGVKAWSNPVGVAFNGNNPKFVNNKNGKRYLILENPRVVNYGLCKGSCDIIGFKTESGNAIFFGLEVKTEGDSTRKHQKKFMEMVNKNGGISGVVRSVEDAMSRLLSHKK